MSLVFEESDSRLSLVAGRQTPVTLSGVYRFGFPLRCFVFYTMYLLKPTVFLIYFHQTLPFIRFNFSLYSCLMAINSSRVHLRGLLSASSASTLAKPMRAISPIR